MKVRMRTAGSHISSKPIGGLTPGLHYIFERSGSLLHTLTSAKKSLISNVESSKRLQLNLEQSRATVCSARCIQDHDGEQER